MNKILRLFRKVRSTLILAKPCLIHLTLILALVTIKLYWQNRQPPAGHIFLIGFSKILHKNIMCLDY